MQRTQIVLCKCGAIIAAAHEPGCSSETLANAIRKNLRIEIIDSKRIADYTWNCACEKGSKP